MGITAKFAPGQLYPNRGARTGISPKTSLRRKPRQLGSLPDSCAEPSFRTLDAELPAGFGIPAESNHSGGRIESKRNNRVEQCLIFRGFSIGRAIALELAAGLED